MNEPKPPPVGAAAPIDDALEREYNLRVRHPERTAVYDGMATRSAALRDALGARFVPLRYGDDERCVVDFCRADAGGPQPLLVFIHGGYWRALERSIFTYIAQPWLARGVHVAFVGYPLVPRASVRQMVAHCRAAVARLRDEAVAGAIDPARVIVSGHSAGAQLGAFSLTADDGWAAAGFVGISGVYDLVPLMATTVNRDLGLDLDEARALSPLGAPPSRRTRHLCAVGGRETDGFRGQTRAYADALRRDGVAADYLEVDGRTHFDVLDDLAREGGALFDGARRLVGR